MGYINKSVSVNSDEKTFIKTFIEQLTQADSRITCDTDIDAEYPNNRSYEPTFTINVGNGCQIVMHRPMLMYDAAGYYTDIYINGVKYTINNNNGIHFMSSDTAKDVVAVRTFKFTVVSNDKVLYIALGDYNSAMLSGAKCSLMCVTDGSLTAAAVSTSNANAVSGNFTVTSQLNNGLTYSFANRVNYTLANSKIEVIKNKSLLGSGGSKILTFDGLYDCSTVPQFVNFKIDKSDYFSVGSHTLMPI